MTAASSQASNSSLTAAWRKSSWPGPRAPRSFARGSRPICQCREFPSLRGTGFSLSRCKVYSFPRSMPSWYEKIIRRYEQMRFDQEPKRRTLPFGWGVEHLGGDAMERESSRLLRPLRRGRDSPQRRMVCRRAGERLRAQARRPHIHQRHRLALARKQSRSRAIIPRARKGTGGGGPRAMECALGGAAKCLPLAEQARASPPSR